MSDAAKLPADQQAAAMATISAEGLPQAIERQAAAGQSNLQLSLLRPQKHRNYPQLHTSSHYNKKLSSTQEFVWHSSTAG